jgi:hypothetical protein
MTESRFNVKNVGENFPTISQITPGFIVFVLISTYNFVIKRMNSLMGRCYFICVYYIKENNHVTISTTCIIARRPSKKLNNL